HGLATLVDDPPYRLRSLLVFASGIGPDGVAAFASSPATSALEELRFHDDPISTRCVKSLCESPHLGALRRLQISRGRLDRDTIDALAGAPFSLDYLHLGSNPELGTDALRRLGDVANLRGLRHLVLDGCKGGDRVLAQLAASDAFPRLASLSLIHTDLTDAGIAALVRWPSFARLRHLWIGTNRLTDASIAAIAGVAQRLVFLETFQTKITAAAVAAQLPTVTHERGHTSHRPVPWPD
ncbi:MAG: hypothetical protein NT062_27135, partial [Proteobacteria bacterium]|nr:hypothetical protein [Pseudomonadota bacterium]